MKGGHFSISNFCVFWATLVFLLVFSFGLDLHQAELYKTVKYKTNLYSVFSPSIWNCCWSTKGLVLCIWVILFIKIMNITISKDFVRETVGDESLLQVFMIMEISNSIQNYVIPLMGPVASVSNLIVVFLCIVIYIKTQKKNHKPAFVFIGFLAAIDAVICG